MGKKSRSENLPDIFKPELLGWQNFEEEVAAHIEKEVAEGALGLNMNTKVRRKPAYYSKDRESNIIFDVSIEVFALASDVTPVLVWVWECKDYPDHRVSVEEVEEFYDKMRQVGAHKGTVVTRHGFRRGALNLAKSRRIGLCVLSKQKLTYLALSRDSGLLQEVDIVATSALFTFGSEVEDMSLEDVLGYEFDGNLDKWKLRPGGSGSR